MSINDQLPVNSNRNAGKSTGSNHANETRFNALKHGLSSDGISEVDDLGSYLALCRQLKRQLKPHGAVEQFLSQRIALGIVRVRRAAKLEADALTEYLHPPLHKPSKEELQLRELMRDSEGELIDPGLPAKVGSGIIETLCDRFGRYETASENRLYRALAQLERLQSVRKAAISTAIAGAPRPSKKAANPKQSIP